MLIPSLIFAISALALLQFFVWYSHSLIAQSRGYELSEQTRQLSGVTATTARSEHFKRLLRLVAMCPEPDVDDHKVRTVAAYFKLLSLLNAVSDWAFPSAARWIESERSGCAYVAAVVLDRRIVHNRMLKAQQAAL